MATLLIACAQPSKQHAHTEASGTAPPAPSGADAATRSKPGRPGIVVGSRAWLVDGSGEGLISVALPLSGGVPGLSRHALSGEPQQLIALGSHIVVTTLSPSALIVLHASDMSESWRMPLPAGASGSLAISGDRVVVVSSAAKKITLVDTTKKTALWTVAVDELPRDISLSHDGTTAYVTHRAGSGVTRLERQGGWDSAPKVVPPLAGEVRIEGVAAAIGNELIAAHGRFDNGKITPEFSALSRPTERWTIPAMAGMSIRTMVSGNSAKSLWVATDDAVLEVGASQGATVLAKASHRCRDPRAMVFAPDDSQLVMSCGDGQVAVVPLPLRADNTTTYYGAPLSRAPSVRADLCKGVDLGKDPLSSAFRHEFLTAAQVEQVMLRYHCRYPARTYLFPIATTHEKRKVWALGIGATSPNHQRPTFFINGGHHGSELMAVTFALDALKALLEDNVATGGLEELVFVVTPLVNPDGNHHRLVNDSLGRKNGRDNNGNGKRDYQEGVDLNRNYPFRWGALGESGSKSDTKHKWYRGPSAASEPETQGVMRLANSEKFVASMSFHTGTLALCAPYTIPEVKQPDPDAGWIVAHEIISKVGTHPEGHIPVKRRLYPLDGNDQDWHRFQNGTLAYLWEGAKNWLKLSRAQMIAPARAIWVELAKRFIHGPAVSVRVTDAAGRPLEAEIAFKEVAHFAGERWTTRCRDGRFDYILPRPGPVTVVVRLGEVTVEREVTVNKGDRPMLQIALPVLIERPAVCATATTDGGPAATVRAL